MSKSYKNVIGLFDTPEATTKIAMSVVTDSRGVSEPKDPDTCNVFALHRLFSKDILSDLDTRYREGTISYKESKEILAQNINTMLAPIREKKVALDANPSFVTNILREGKEKADELARAKMNDVRQKTGFNRY